MISNHSGLRVRVLGGGLAGLSCSWFLQQSGRVRSLEVYDLNRPGFGGASSLAVLMHPFSPRGTVIWRGLEGCEATKSLLRLAAKHDRSGKKGCLYSTNRRLVRPLYSNQALMDWGKTAAKFPQWFQLMSGAQYVEEFGVGTLQPLGSVCYTDATIVDAPRYLQGLWSAIQDSSAHMSNACEVRWIQFSSQQDPTSLLDDCDALVVASGAGSNDLWRQLDSNGTTADLPFMYVRGQHLCFDADGIEADTAAIVLSAEFPSYVLPVNGQLVCGATHEYGQLTDLISRPPSIKRADELLRQKLRILYPRLGGRNDGTPEPQAVSCAAAVRVSTKRCHFGRLPVIGQHPMQSKAWLIAGFGSKGLVHHAVLGRALAAAITHATPVPEDMRL